MFQVCFKYVSGSKCLLYWPPQNVHWELLGRVEFHYYVEFVSRVFLSCGIIMANTLLIGERIKKKNLGLDNVRTVIETL